jgi:general secretion pathway protein G
MQPRRASLLSRRGFTLLELLAVIAIIAVLSGIVIGVGRRASESGKAARAKAELATIGAALETYKRSYGDYPRTDDEARLLQALIGKRGPASDVEIDGRSLLEAVKFTIARPVSPSVLVDPFTDTSAVLVDPWERPYVYVYKVPAGDWKNPGFVLYSVGPDGSDNASLLSGGFPDVASPANADNIHANRN